MVIIECDYEIADFHSHLSFSVAPAIMSSDDDVIVIDEITTETRWYCRVCAKQFPGSDAFSQHKRSAKHKMSERYVEEQYKVVKSIQASDFATTNDRYDICIKHVEQLQSTSAWIEQELIMGYLQIVQTRR